MDNAAGRLVERLTRSLSLAYMARFFILLLFFFSLLLLFLLLLWFSFCLNAVLQWGEWKSWCYVTLRYVKLFFLVFDFNVISHFQTARHWNAARYVALRYVTLRYCSVMLHDVRRHTCCCAAEKWRLLVTCVAECMCVCACVYAMLFFYGQLNETSVATLAINQMDGRARWRYVNDECVCVCRYMS